jgi:radical SAM superfamily enzyme YgiQ (UPF0313 family)
MKVVLMSVNASWTHSCLALYYLRNAISELDFEVEIIELTLKQSLNEALETIYIAQPDVLCLSVYIWNADFIRNLIPELRKILREVIIILGGPEVSYNEHAFAEFKPDYLVKGYGEQAFRKLAEQSFVSNAKVIKGEFLSLSEISFPYREKDKAQLTGKLLYYEASRGCACKCIYCLSSREEKLDWLPLERVKSDLDRLVQLKPKVVKFVDRCFNLKRDWARAIWEYVISLDTEIPFHFEVHPDWLEAEDFSILSQAPQQRIQFEIGIQSIHPQTLTTIRRPSDWNQVKANLRLLKEKTVIQLHVDLIAGLPGEDLQAVQNSINEVLQTRPAELQLGFLKILKGTEMAEKALTLRYKWSDLAPYQVMQTPDLNFTEIMQLEKISSLINQYWNKGDFVTVWAKVIEWRKPFDCLLELLKLNLDTDNQLHSIDRVKRFELMSAWIEQNWSGEQKPYLSDALRWDWCRKAGEAWFPAALKAESCLSFRKEHYQQILEWLKTEYWQHEDWNLKRFITFSGASNAFCNDFLQGYTKAAFINRKSGDNACVTITQLM